MGLKEMTAKVQDALHPPSAEAAEARRLIAQYRAETDNNGREKPFAYDSKPSEFPGGRAILESALEMQTAVLLELVKDKNSARYGSPLVPLKSQLLSRKLPLSLSEVETLLDRAAESNSWDGNWGATIKKTRQYLEDGGALTPTLTNGLEAIRTQATAYSSAENRRFVMQIDELLSSHAKESWYLFSGLVPTCARMSLTLWHRVSKFW